MRRVKRSRTPKMDAATAAWVAGDPPPADVDHDRLVGLIYFREHPRTRWRGHHPQERAWLDALAGATA